MKNKKTRRSNEARSGATRKALIAAGRKLFAQKGFAETGTPELVAAAGVTRGALYHQFDDKADLLLAVLREEAQAVTRAIEAASPASASPRDALLAGAMAYFEAMAKPGRARLLLVEAPAVLSPDAMARLEKEGGAASLRDGLATTRPDMEPDMLDALADMLSAAFDRAASKIAQGAEAAPYNAAIGSVLSALAE